MAWDLLFARRHTSKKAKRWGLSLESNPQHLAPEQYAPLKHSYDELAEECLNKLDAISPPQPFSAHQQRDRQEPRDEKQGQPQSPPCPFSRDLYALLRDHRQSDTKLQQLWTELNTVPSWVDWNQIQRGQDVFYRYGGPILIGLAYQSLLGGMGANRGLEASQPRSLDEGYLKQHEVNPSETSKLMANNIIKSLEEQPPSFASRALLVASARWLNGKELGDALGLERPHFWFKALVLGQCIFFMAITYYGRLFPKSDQRRITLLKKMLYAIMCGFYFYPDLLSASSSTIDGPKNLMLGPFQGKVAWMENIVAVIDIDCAVFNAFDQFDQDKLEELADLGAAHPYEPMFTVNFCEAKAAERAAPLSIA
ncbi:MAG: hypothetical protein Q9159_006696 [Coniocarpon cinnabarinum]